MAAQTDDYCNKTLPLSVSSCHTFSGPIFPYNSIWLVEIYVTGCIPKLFLVKAIMKGVRNIVDDVKFIITTKMCSVLVAVWHYECDRLGEW
jgi:hypothetical protein